MRRTVTEISAVGTVRGVKGQKFVVRPNREGLYALHKKTTSPTEGNTTNRLENQVLVGTLQEAWELLQTDEYQISMVPESGGPRSLRCLKSVRVEYQ